MGTKQQASAASRLERVADTDQDTLRRLYDLFDAVDRFDDPHGARATRRHFTGMLTYGWAGEPREIWAAGEGAEITGYYCIELPDRDNTHLAYAELNVHPAARRRGIGRGLLAHLTDRVRAHGRRVVLGEAGHATAGAAFAEAAGAEAVASALRQVLDLETIDVTAYEALKKEARAAAAGYTLVRWQGPVPHEHRPGMVTLRNTMNDAPIDDIDMEDVAWDLDRVRATEQGYELRGVRTYMVAARRDSDGELAAYTDLNVDGDGPWAHQEDTAVARGHRGNRLGLLVKLAMTDWLRESEPTVTKIVTWNAESNRHMRAVNDRLGYREVDRWNEWQVRL